MVSAGVGFWAVIFHRPTLLGGFQSRTEKDQGLLHNITTKTAILSLFFFLTRVCIEKKSSSNWFDSHVQIFFEFSANWKTLWGNLLDPNSMRSCTILTNYYKNIGLCDDVNLYYFFQYKVYYIWYVLVLLLCYTSTSPTDFLFSSTEGLNRMNSEEVWNRDRC